MSATAYFLSRDCFVCRMGCYWIILSAGRDRYLCVSHDDLVSIGSRLHGWRDQKPVMTSGSSLGANANTFLGSLISNGIITSNPATGKPFIGCALSSPESGMEISEAVASESLPFGWVARFFLACGAADWQLRTRSFSRNLERLERRRCRVQSSSTMIRAASVSKLMQAFKVLRPFYPRPYLCLFDSLAVLEYLAGYHFFPRMVFGVVADPFQAHCWIQEGSAVLNDDLERVRRYKPILSV